MNEECALRARNSNQLGKPALVISIVGGLALLAGIASEVGRLVLKGQNYAFAYFNDVHFYTAMATGLWQAPMDVRTEIAQLGF